MVTVVVALIVSVSQDGLLYGSSNSPILLVALACALGAATGHYVSGAFRLGLVGGLLFGVFGFHLAISASSLGAKVAEETLCFLCVSAGGVIGGLTPAMLQQWRRASARTRRSLLLAGVALLLLAAWRWRAVSIQTEFIMDLQAAGGFVYYSDINPLPLILDEDRMDSRTEWLRTFLGMRVVQRVDLQPKVDHRRYIQLMVENLPNVEDLRLRAEHIDDDVFVVLNSGKLPKLNSLRFTSRAFDDAALARLHSLPNLLLLSLNETSITDVSIEHLATFPRLRILSVYKTKVTADGVKRLRLKIPRVVDKY
ncbi:hypothetical protein [Lacipirellula parvula]|uniref:Uncharacterized protein n=1 Tax=Lacipirellula parvula TaxID=2650471 RepID=A0A5K7XJD7_9BACT|nr:hypothetical protein [Lacipirellula parvula]BBO34506.1 hypothetical protein PLANPX_4118 [Lacipirellula parvula]